MNIENMKEAIDKTDEPICDYIESLIRIADQYKQDRDLFILVSIYRLVETIKGASFAGYEFKNDTNN